MAYEYHLPNELWSMVFAHTGGTQYKPIFIKISMTCRLFRALLLPEIFSDFEVLIEYDYDPKVRHSTCPWRTHTYRQLFDFISANAPIAKFVHTLRLYVQMESLDTWEMQKPHWDPDLFLAIANALPHLAHLHLHNALFGDARAVSRALTHHRPLQLTSLHIALTNSFSRSAVPVRLFAGLLQAVARADTLDLVNLAALEPRGGSTLRIPWPEHLACTALKVAEEAYSSAIVQGIDAWPAFDSLTSLEVQDDWRYCDFNALGPVLEEIGPNLEHLGLGMNLLPGELGRAVHDWHTYVFSRCKKLRSLAFFLWIYPSSALDPNAEDHQEFLREENTWGPAKRVLEYMLQSAGLPTSDDEEPAEDSQADSTDAEDGSADESAWEDASDASGGYDLYKGPYEFTPGTLHTLALRLVAHCDIFACPCRLGDMRADWGAQRVLFDGVDDALARCAAIPGVRTLQLGLTPNSNAAWLVRDWRNVARKLLPPFFPKTAATGMLEVQEFARWPCRGGAAIDNYTWNDGDEDFQF